MSDITDELLKHDAIYEALVYGRCALEADLKIAYTTFSTDDGWGRTNDKSVQLARINAAIAERRSSIPQQAKEGDGWIEWKGGECPVFADDKVQMKFRDETVTDALFGCDTFIWYHTQGAGDIIAYRLASSTLGGTE